MIGYINKITKSERRTIDMAVSGVDEKGYIIEDYDKVIKKIVVKNREHLDALIRYVQDSAQGDAHGDSAL